MTSACAERASWPLGSRVSSTRAAWRSNHSGGTRGRSHSGATVAKALRVPDPDPSPVLGREVDREARPSSAPSGHLLPGGEGEQIRRRLVGNPRENRARRIAKSRAESLIEFNDAESLDASEVSAGGHDCPPTKSRQEWPGRRFLAATVRGWTRPGCGWTSVGDETMMILPRGSHRTSEQVILALLRAL
jgi:hypothetical protein